jgi:hypothetical protein
MSKFVDLTGMKFGRLTVLRQSGYCKNGKKKQSQWECICDCGKIVNKPVSSIKQGKTKSCGCLFGDVMKATFVKHGETGTRLYEIWSHMRRRCLRPSDPAYKNYGGRGIAACKEWDDYTVFREWALSHGYADNLTIDRKDNDGNYEPSNCKWSTMKEQSNNRRSNHLLTLGGITKNINQWSESIGIGRTVIKGRINNYGWSAEKTLMKPIKGRHTMTFNGKTQTAKEWSMELGINYQTLLGRLNRHKWTTEKALTEPIHNTNSKRPE